MSNSIVTENALPGTTAWKWTTVATTQLQAYANVTSLDAGQSINFFVSTQVGGTTYTINIYRLGWYQGYGANLKASIPGQVGVAQGYYDPNAKTLNNCPTAIINNTTHLIEAGWTSSYTWNVPANAVTGVYLAQFTDQNNLMTYVGFVVRGNTNADYCYARAVTTDCAYNDWGGFSLYTTPTPAVKVSFNRPDVNGGGTGGLFRFELGAIHWLEKQGYNLSYLTSIDVHINAAQLQNYKAFLSPGHDEYWSKEMRDGVEAALVSGVGLGFLGANACYWQIRFEPDAASNPNRTITCYKVLASGGPAYSTDPFYGVDNTRVTSLWRDPVINRPENTMIGIMFTDLSNGVSYWWKVDAAANSPYLQGTGLLPGQFYGIDLVGYEWDKQQAGGPANLQIIGTSAPLNQSSQASVSNTTTYVAPSGALVFASGSIGWTQCLDTYRWSNPLGGPLTVDAMQAFFANIMTGLIKAKSPAPVVKFGAFAMHQ